jgi:hypothetical protein
MMIPLEDKLDAWESDAHNGRVSYLRMLALISEFRRREADRQEAVENSERLQREYTRLRKAAHATSPDAGLVERKAINALTDGLCNARRRGVSNTTVETNDLEVAIQAFAERAAALEAKDAEIARLRAVLVEVSHWIAKKRRQQNAKTKNYGAEKNPLPARLDEREAGRDVLFRSTLGHGPDRRKVWL